MAGKRLIVKVAGVGLLAGLIGGGVSYGVGNDAQEVSHAMYSSGA